MTHDDSKSALRLVFPEKQRVACEPVALRPLGEGDVLVKTAFSLMSTGTENTVYNGLFAPGTHWESWAKFPFYPGYASVGEVARVGSRVESLRPGQLVVSRQGHCSSFVAPASDCYEVPSGLEPQQAAWF